MPPARGIPHGFIEVEDSDGGKDSLRTGEIASVSAPDVSQSVQLRPQSRDTEDPSELDLFRSSLAHRDESNAENAAGGMRRDVGSAGALIPSGVLSTSPLSLTKG